MTKAELERWEVVLLGEGPVSRDDRKKLWEIIQTLPPEKQRESKRVLRPGRRKS